jgi:hypothetical protein
MRVCNADLVLAAFFGTGASTLFIRTSGLLSRVTVFGFGFALAFAFALGAVDLRFLAGFALGDADFAAGFDARLAFGFEAADLRLFAGAFVVVF